MTELIRYDAACKAIAEARSVDEVKGIRDKAIALKLYARQAKNKSMEADAAEIRLRAERRVGQMMLAQKQTVGLASGGEHGGKRTLDGVRKTPSNARPTLAESGVDKNLAKQARALVTLTDKEFEITVEETRKAVTEVARNVVKQRTKKHRRAERVETMAAKTLPTGRFSIVVFDVPWRTETWSEKGMDRSADNHYPTMSLDEIKALPVPSLLAPDALCLFWATVPHMKNAFEVLEAWGLEYKSMLTWDKVVAGTGKWFMNQTEHLILATRGNVPAPVEDQLIPSLWREKKTRHSAKPEGILEWVERLYPDLPKLEMFRRGPARPGWVAYGNEVDDGEEMDSRSNQEARSAAS